jgi:hypothetical protein
MKNPDIVPWKFIVSALVAGLLIVPTLGWAPLIAMALGIATVLYVARDW